MTTDASRAEHARATQALTRALTHALDLDRLAGQSTRAGQYTVRLAASDEARLAAGKLVWHGDTTTGMSAVLHNPDGTIAKHLRLDEIGPDVHRLVVGLATHATLATVLETLDRVEATLRAVRRELFEDRLARVDAARAQLEDALLIGEPSVRATALLNAAQTGQEAFAMLLRQTHALIDEGVESPTWLQQLMAPWRSSVSAYEEKIEALHATTFAMIRAAGVVIESYGALGEPGAAGSAMTRLEDGFRALDCATVQTWARFTDPALGADELWGTHLPELPEVLAEAGHQLASDPVPVVITLEGKP